MEKRRVYLDRIPEIENENLYIEVESLVNSIIDDWMGVSCEIRDILYVSSIYDLSNIEDAYNIAKKVSDDLY